LVVHPDEPGDLLTGLVVQFLKGDRTYDRVAQVVPSRRFTSRSEEDKQTEAIVFARWIRMVYLLLFGRGTSTGAST
jgi:hypothetical protein